MNGMTHRDGRNYRWKRFAGDRYRVGKREWRRQTRRPPRHYWINRDFLNQLGSGGKVPMGFLSPGAGKAEIEAFVREIWEMHLELERRRQAAKDKQH